MDTATQIPMGSRAGLTRPPRVPVLVAIVVAAAALAAVSTWLATNEGVPDIEVALLQWISIPYIAAGLIAWWRRPESRLGPADDRRRLQHRACCACSSSTTTCLWSIGALLDIFAGGDLPPRDAGVPLGAPALATRSGRWWSPPTRSRSASQIAKMMFGAFGPDNLLAVASTSDATRVVERVQLFALRRDLPRRPWRCSSGGGAMAGRPRRCAGPPCWSSSSPSAW